MTKNISQKSNQKLYKNWTGNQIRGLGQFLVKTWSAFQCGQPSCKMRVEILRQHCGKVSVVLELSQARSVENQGGQKVSRNGADFEGLSLEVCRQGDGEMSVVFDPSFVLLQCIAQYKRKSPVQLDIPSSYLYVVVLKKPDL